MSEKQLTTAWVWPANGGILGLYIDTDAGRLHWFDNFECQCMDDGGFAEQTLAEFERDGIPTGVSAVPEDVLAELRTTTSALGTAS